MTTVSTAGAASALWASATAGAAALWQTLVSLKDRFMTAGADLMQGLVNGINAMLARLEQGLIRAIATGRLYLEGKLTLYASDAFLRRNQNRDPQQQLAAQPELIKMYQAHGIPMRTGFVTAAFGCNFEGDVAPEKVVALVGQMRAIARDAGEDLSLIGLGDTMGWATPVASRMRVMP